jgi:hypothetical protein
MTAYSNKEPVDSSMLVHFRQRIGINLVNKINEKMVKDHIEIPREVEKKLIRNQV